MATGFELTGWLLLWLPTRLSNSGEARLDGSLTLKLQFRLLQLAGIQNSALG